MGKIDKKQMPQLLALGLLTIALFGFFVMRMLSPTPAAAHVQSVAAAASVKAKVVDNTTLADAPPPGPAMRDPFRPGIVDNEAMKAYLEASKSAVQNHHPPEPAMGQRMAQNSRATNSNAGVPHVSQLPGFTSNFSAYRGPSSFTGQTSNGTVTPAIISLPAPTWTVTGVIQSSDGQEAVLRSGEARRIVRRGDQVDSDFRVVSVTRNSVTLRRGTERFTLPLGGPKVPSTSPLSTPGQPGPSGIGIPAAPANPPASSPVMQ
jgi:hypothetical protein